MVGLLDTGAWGLVSWRLSGDFKAPEVVMGDFPESEDRELNGGLPSCVRKEKGVAARLSVSGTPAEKKTLCKSNADISPRVK